jgi:hypothetical protein
MDKLKWKRLALPALVAAFALVAFTAQAVFAVSYTDTSADFSGRGVVMPSGLDPDGLEVELLSPSTVEGAPHFFTDAIMDISYSIGEDELATPLSLTYVYYNLDVVERDGWEEGRTSLYYEDRATGQWVKCASFFVSGGSSGNGRLACLAPQFTMFGIGIEPVNEEFESGGTVSPGVVNANISGNTALFGNLGVYVPAGINTDQVAIRVLQHELESVPEASGFNFDSDVINLEWVQDDIALQAQLNGDAESQAGADLTIPLQLSYIFFNLDVEEREAWENDDLSIYYYNRASSSWQACATFFVFGGNSDQGRVACVAPQFTMYVLGNTTGD